MAPLILAILLLAIALMVGALWALRSSEQAALWARVNAHFGKVSGLRLPREETLHQWRGTRFERWLWRSGLHATPLQLVGIGGLALLLVLLAGQLKGVLAATIVGLVLLAAAIVWPQTRYHQRVEKMTGQLPLFLDQMVRALATGRNMDGALQLAAGETPAPLGAVMARVQKTVELGADMGEALRDTARLYALRELYFVAMAVQIARSYGSSPREMLESVSSLVRHREQAQRELRALTGETRVSAWLLSLLPSALALYMVAVNPGYLDTMWNDPGGRITLFVALGLQATGGFILWRMVKSV